MSDGGVTMRTAGVSVVISHSACGIQGTRVRVRRTHGPTLFFFFSFFLPIALLIVSLLPLSLSLSFLALFHFSGRLSRSALNASLPPTRSIVRVHGHLRSEQTLSFSRHSQAVQDIASYPAGPRVRSKWFLARTFAGLDPSAHLIPALASNSPPRPGRPR